MPTHLRKPHRQSNYALDHIARMVGSNAETFRASGLERKLSGKR